MKLYNVIFIFLTDYSIFVIFGEFFQKKGFSLYRFSKITQNPKKLPGKRPTTERKLESDSQSKGAKKKTTNANANSPVAKKKPVKQSSDDEEYSSEYDESDYDDSENSESSSSDKKSQSKTKNTGKLSKTSKNLPKEKSLSKSDQLKKTATKPSKIAKKDSLDSDSSYSQVGSVRGVSPYKSTKNTAKKENSTKSQKPVAKTQKLPVKKVQEDEEYPDYSDEKPSPKPTKKQPPKPKSKSSKQHSSYSESDEKPPPKSKNIPAKKLQQKPVKKTKKPSSDSESEYEDYSYEESEEEKPKSIKTTSKPAQKQPSKKAKPPDKIDKTKQKITTSKKPSKKESSSEYEEDEYEEEEEEEDSSESSDEKPIKKKDTGKKETKQLVKKPTKTKQKVDSESSESSESEDKPKKTKNKKEDKKKQPLKDTNDDSEISSYNTQTDETPAVVTFEINDSSTSNPTKPFDASYSSELSPKKTKRTRKRRSKKKSQQDGDTVTNEEIITDEFGRRKKIIRRYVLIKADDTSKATGEVQKDDDIAQKKLSITQKREKIREEEEKSKKIIAANELTIEKLKLEKELENVKSQKIINYYANIDSVLAEEIKALKAKHRLKCQQFQKLYNYDTQRKYETNIERENEITAKLNELITNYNDKVNPKIDKIGRIQQKPENISRNSLILVSKNIRELRIATIKEKKELIKLLSTQASELQGIHFDTQDDIQRIEKEIKMELQKRDEKMFNIYGKVLDRQQIKLTDKIEQKNKSKEQSANRGIRVQTYQDRFDTIYLKSGYDMKKSLYISDAYDHYERKLIEEKKQTANAHYNLRVQSDKLESLKQGTGDFAEIEKRGEVKKVLDEYTAQLGNAKKMILEMREQIARYNRLNKSRDKKSVDLHIELQMLYTDEETEDMMIKIKHMIDSLDQLLKGVTAIDKKYGGDQNEQIQAMERYESMKCTAEKLIFGYNKHEIENAAGNSKKHIPKLMNVHDEYRELINEMYNEQSVQEEFELIVDNDDETNIFDFEELDKPTEEEEEEEDTKEKKPTQQ